MLLQFSFHLDSSLSFSGEFNAGAPTTLQAGTMTKKQRSEAAVSRYVENDVNLIKETYRSLGNKYNLNARTVNRAVEKAAKHGMSSLRYRVKPVAVPAQMQKKLSIEDETFIRLLIDRFPYLYLDEVVSLLKHHRFVDITLATACNVLNVSFYKQPLSFNDNAA